MEQRILLNLRDIQQLLGIGRNKALSLMRTEGFPSIQIGRTYHVEQKALYEWIENNKGKTIQLK